MTKKYFIYREIQNGSITKALNRKPKVEYLWRVQNTRFNGVETHWSTDTEDVMDFDTKSEAIKIAKDAGLTNYKIGTLEKHYIL